MSIALRVVVKRHVHAGLDVHPAHGIVVSATEAIVRTPNRQIVQLSMESIAVNCGKSTGRNWVEGW